MDRNEAEKAIKTLFQLYKGAYTNQDAADVKKLSVGKIYELYVLSKVVEDLVNRNCSVRFVGTSVKFKASPGMLKTSDPHFTVRTPHGHDLWLFVDIEFDTLGHTQTMASDNSRRHELDIVLVSRDSG